jgi:uncharacterized membrane protein/uncharacterized membrane protein YeaQ/YmgE (transglycosylase-associated protein family)
MLDLVTWTATGLVTGWLVRTLLRSRRDFGLTGDLTTGWLGGLIGGWIFRSVGASAPDGPAGHVLVASFGAITLMAVLRLMRHLASAAGVAPGAGTVADDGRGDSTIGTLGHLERRIVDAVLTRRWPLRDPLQVEAEATFGERVADKVAQLGGSWTFIGVFVTVLVAWMALNSGAGAHFDPFPFILLNLALSCVAALQAPVIMMSQNRQSAKDRADARSDYEVNLRAEFEIAALHTKLDLLREQEWTRLLSVVEQQRHTLDDIQRQLAALGDRDPRG